MSNKEKVAVIGDGAWGTALAMVLHSSGRETVIWGHRPEYLESMRQSRENRLFLPGVVIPDGIGFQEDINAAMRWADLIVTAVPSKHLRQVLSQASHGAAADKPVLSATKGLDAETLRRPSEVVAECLGTRQVVALAGPCHAFEVARGLPTTVVAASEELDAARRIQRIVSTPRFRVYASRDIAGAEVAGAVKNIIALASGILESMKMGENALASLATRGLVEMTRLGVALGADPHTFTGLAGVGDMFATCISSRSRNRNVGRLLAEGQPLDKILSGMNGIPESISTTTLVLQLAKKLFVDMPITEQVAAVLWDHKSPEKALTDLMSRERKDED